MLPKRHRMVPVRLADSGGGTRARHSKERSHYNVRSNGTTRLGVACALVAGAPTELAGAGAGADVVAVVVVLVGVVAARAWAVLALRSHGECTSGWAEDDGSAPGAVVQAVEDAYADGDEAVFLGLPGEAGH